MHIRYHHLLCRRGIGDTKGPILNHLLDHSDTFSREFDELDSVLANKLSELKECATDEKVAQKKLIESEERLRWLENIQNRVNMILEI